MRRWLVVLVLALVAAPSASAAGDPMRGQQWALDRIGAPVAWQSGVGSGVVIAVVDTGADLGHEDLRDRVVPGYNFVNPGQPPQDDNGHGTHVSGIAAATANNGRGIAGVAPGARIMPVKVLAADGSGYADDISSGIRWAVDHGAAVVNLSLGEKVRVLQTVRGSAFRDALDYAWSKGVICVVAAGNDAVFSSGYKDAPAIVVVATDQNDNWASYSNSSGGLLDNTRWGISAPGGAADGNPAHDILSTYWYSGKQNQYATAAGTSMAAPHVAGAVAILRGLGLSPQQTVDRLMATARDLGPPGRDDTFGYGLVDLANATASLRSAAPGAQVSGTSPASSGPESRKGTARTTPAQSVVARAGTPASSGGPVPAPAANASATAAPGGSQARRASSPAPASHATAVALVATLALLAAAGGTLGLRRLRMSR